MAKLKEKIKDLQTQFGITEDAAKAVLALHDGDLAESSALVAAEQAKVAGWNEWYTEKAPQITAALQELETLKAFKAQVESAGIRVQPTQPALPTQNTPVVDDLKSAEARIYQNFSKVQEDIYNIQRTHMKNYKELPDLAPIKKLIEEKNLAPWAAYQEWVGPMETERTTKELTDKITAELTAKFQNENTRAGVNGFLTNRAALTGEEVTSPLDEVIREQSAARLSEPKTPSASGPGELELMADFIGTMRNGRVNSAH